MEPNFDILMHTYNIYIYIIRMTLETFPLRMVNLKGVGFNVGLELLGGLLPTVWDSSLKMVRRHAITILTFRGGDGSPALLPSEV